MSKCTFETECKGNGICCLYCKHIRFCNSVCQLIDRNETREELEADVKKCDWFEKEEQNMGEIKFRGKAKMSEEDLNDMNIPKYGKTGCIE